jgi:hypothetical protein
VALGANKRPLDDELHHTEVYDWNSIANERMKKKYK